MQTNFSAFFPHCLHSTFLFFLSFSLYFFFRALSEFFSLSSSSKLLSPIIYSLRVLYFKVRKYFLLSRSNRTTHISITVFLSFFQIRPQIFANFIQRYYYISSNIHFFSRFYIFLLIFHSRLNKFFL